MKISNWRSWPSEDPAELGSCRGVARASSEASFWALAWALGVVILETRSEHHSWAQSRHLEIALPYNKFKKWWLRHHFFNIRYGRALSRCLLWAQMWCSDLVSKITTKEVQARAQKEASDEALATPLQDRSSAGSSEGQLRHLAISTVATISIQKS